MRTTSSFSTNASFFHRAMRSSGVDNDNGSVSSTITVDANTTATSDLVASSKIHQLQCQATTKRVRFDETANTHYDNLQLVKHETKALWYTRLEMDTFKAVNWSHEREIIRIELDNNQRGNLSYLKVMERVLLSCCCAYETELHPADWAAFRRVLLASSSPSEDPNENEEATVEVDAGMIQYDDDGYADFDDRVGLERTTVRALREDKKVRRKEVVETVLDIQEDCHYLPAAEVEKMMAYAAQEISQPSRVFAARLAQARALQ